MDSLWGNVFSNEFLDSYSSVCHIQGLHSASTPGILALDVQLSDTSKVLTGIINRRESARILLADSKNQTLLRLKPIIFLWRSSTRWCQLLDLLLKSLKCYPVKLFIFSLLQCMLIVGIFFQVVLIKMQLSFTKIMNR